MTAIEILDMRHIAAKPLLEQALLGSFRQSRMYFPVQAEISQIHAESLVSWHLVCFKIIVYVIIIW